MLVFHFTNGCTINVDLSPQERDALLNQLSTALEAGNSFLIDSQISKVLINTKHLTHVLEEQH